MRDLSSTLKGTKELQSILVPAVSHITLTWNNLYAKVAYLRVAYSDPLQYSSSILKCFIQLHKAGANIQQKVIVINRKITEVFEEH